jgi:hypothetical protein
MRKWPEKLLVRPDHLRLPSRSQRILPQRGPMESWARPDLPATAWPSRWGAKRLGRLASAPGLRPSRGRNLGAAQPEKDASPGAERAGARPKRGEGRGTAGMMKRLGRGPVAEEAGAWPSCRGSRGAAQARGRPGARPRSAQLAHMPAGRDWKWPILAHRRVCR